MIRAIFAAVAICLAALLAAHGAAAQASVPPAPGPTGTVRPVMRAEDRAAMFAIRDKLPTALQTGLNGDDPCTWTIFNSTCPLLECRLYNGTSGQQQVYVTKFILDLPYDRINASTSGVTRAGPTFYSYSQTLSPYPDRLNPATSSFSAIDLPSDSGEFITHRPNRNAFHTPEYCLSTYSGRVPTGGASFLPYITDVSGWTDNVGFEMPLDLLSNLSRLDTIYIPGPSNISIYKGITGTLPSQWASLPLLTTVILGNNSLNGSLPEEWGNPGAMRKLQILTLQNNKISGAIPVGWGQPGAFANLRYLDINYNNLSGPFPALGTSLDGTKETNNNTSFYNLTALYLRNNSLEGPWPTSLENLRNLTELDLSNNLLTGTLPASMFNAPAFGSLYHLLLANNNFTGILPDAAPSVFSRWPYRSLDGPLLFDVSGNKFLSGTIPDSWSAAGNSTFIQEMAIFAKDTALCGLAPLNVSPLVANTSSSINLIFLYAIRSQALTMIPRVSRARLPACV